MVYSNAIMLSTSLYIYISEVDGCTIGSHVVYALRRLHYYTLSRNKHKPTIKARATYTCSIDYFCHIVTGRGIGCLGIRSEQEQADAVHVKRKQNIVAARLAEPKGI
jgi:hypothetical protein